MVFWKKQGKTRINPKTGLQENVAYVRVYMETGYQEHIADNLLGEQWLSIWYWEDYCAKDVCRCYPFPF